MILAGDIGGTKTALGLFSREHGPGSPLAEDTFPSGDYGGLEEIVKAFLDRRSAREVERACFAVAGPVREGKVRVTNLPWTVDSSRLARECGIPEVRLMNDVQALGSAIPHLAGTDLERINAGRPVPGGARAVIAAGTGLGEAFLTWNGSSYRSHPTEGGHADFGPADEEQAGLWRRLSREHGHVSWERVCSGLGIPNIYGYLKDTGRYPRSPSLAERAGKGVDITPAIIDAALAETSPCRLCRDTLAMFVALLGAESGNLALKTMATGGLYLGGGIPPRILPVLKGDGFMKAFTGKGRLSELMADIPVHVVLNSGASLLGAASEAMHNDPHGSG